LAAELLYKDEVYAIVGACIEVHRELGSGFAEAVYQEALEREFTGRKIPFLLQKELKVFYKGTPLRKFYIPDFICYEKIILEIKSLDSLSGKEESQLLNYLKTTGYRVGVLVNFGSVGILEWKRFIY
jgi:GxxExxY protein